MHEVPSLEQPSRRNFLKMGALAGMSMIGSSPLWAQESAGGRATLRVVAIGAGGRANANIGSLESHPAVRFVGFCDVNRQVCESRRETYPDAFYVQDYREVFADHGDEFDAVVVSTPDHMHAPVVLTALAAGKHVYGEKPLVHQLDELRMIRGAVAAKPNLVTQMGNQRSCNQPKMGLSRGLREGLFGDVHQAWVWTDKMDGGNYFTSPWQDDFPQAEETPEHLDWNLWLGCSRSNAPYSQALASVKWRTYWEFGNGLIGDWGAHILDTVFYGLNLRRGPISVRTDAPREATRASYGTYIRSQMVFEGGPGIAGDVLPVTSSDSMILPSFAAHGLPANPRLRPNMTMIETDHGTLVFSAEGDWRLFNRGRDISSEIELPQLEAHNHWHDWVDNCLGGDKQLWSPFDIGSWITEATILPVKASRFPGQELRWDSVACRFEGNDEANESIVSRNYRDGFAVPAEFV